MGDFDTTAVADDALELCAFVLAAGALIVTLWTKDPFTEQTILFRPVGSVVDGLGLLDFTKAPTPNVIGACQGDLDGMDSLLATVQMPKGVPVATFAIGKSGAINAAICAAQIIGTSDDEMAKKLDEYKLKMHADVLEANESIQ